MIWLRRILCLVFGVAFVYAGFRKIQDPGLFLIDIRSFDLLPDPFAAWLALGLPWLELLAGLAVMIGFLRKGGLLLLNLALGAFFVAILSAWSRGLDIRCGCFGSSEASTSYIELIARDSVLLAMGLFLLLRDGREGARR